MLEAGSDARIRNKGGLTPSQLCDPSDVESKRVLQDAVEVGMNEGDFIVDERDLASGGEEDDVGSASDSDFDPEEYRREKERREKRGGGEGQPF